MAEDKNSPKKQSSTPSANNDEKQPSPAGTKTDVQKHQDTVDKEREENNKDQRIFDL